MVNRSLCELITFRARVQAWLEGLSSKQANQAFYKSDIADNTIGKGTLISNIENALRPKFNLLQPNLNK